MSPFLRLSDVTHAYGARTVVRSVSLDLQQDETLAIVGESGAGKSTLLEIVGMLVRPTSGRVLFEERDVWALTDAEVREQRRTVQVVLQEAGASLSPRWTVRQSLEEAWTVFGETVGEAELVRALERVGLSASLFLRRPFELSGGQKQRVAIARALARNPRVLLLDEPFAGLDVSIAAQIFELLASLRSSLGLSMIIVTHDLTLVRHLADRVAVMADGQVVEMQETAALFSTPQAAQTRALLDAMPRLR